MAEKEAAPKREKKVKVKMEIINPKQEIYGMNFPMTTMIITIDIPKLLTEMSWIKRLKK